ncbi:MetQ/NlpA family ABC transporter substrate-binding protein [Corynebacterium tapiri]|uniref:Methionine ABC transporter substrate-binding protein n=1 Tax=Corynebacterium tapiri TaxID=1448266 RepID=A0A5C4U5K5_9CORY|nr:MetQ/NlpA family ABC transporter substrate-binding protein [Corynebacterium tapiri]TNL98487.1 methionine ABC transporter substrate-binding protein [Corynebacterium tapiri]
MKLNRIIAGAAAVAISATGLVACGGNGGGDTIKVGTTDASLKEWEVFEDLAKDKGIKVDVVNFSDYNTPNDALSQGEIDVNKFQHLQFLDNYNQGAGTELKAISSGEIYPLALFWKDHSSLDGIEGQRVAIPNDATNQGRGINVLVQAGLLTLKKEGLLNPTPADIDTEASKVEVVPVDAAQTTISYNEGLPAIINNSFLERAGIDAKSAIFQDDPNSELAEPYINVWVTTPEKAEDPKIKELAELWKDPAVTEAVVESSGGTAVPVDRTPEQLAAVLDRLKNETK